MSLLSLFSSYLFKENMLINDENCPYQISNFKVQCSIEDVSRVLLLETGNLSMLKLGQGIRDVETLFLFIDFLQLFGTSCVTQGF